MRVHVFAEVQHDGRAYGLAGERTAAAARKHGRLAATCDLDDGLDVFPVARDHDADGLDLIEAGVGAVEHTCEAVEVDFTLHDALDLVRQIAILSGNGSHFCGRERGAGRRDERGHVGAFPGGRSTGEARIHST